MLARRKLSISIKTPAFIVFRFLSLTVNHSHMDAPCQRIMQVLNQPELPSGCRWSQNAHGSAEARSQHGNRRNRRAVNPIDACDRKRPKEALVVRIQKTPQGLSTKRFPVRVLRGEPDETHFGI